MEDEEKNEEEVRMEKEEENEKEEKIEETEEKGEKGEKKGSEGKKSQESPNLPQTDDIIFEQQSESSEFSTEPSYTPSDDQFSSFKLKSAIEVFFKKHDRNDDCPLDEKDKLKLMQVIFYKWNEVTNLLKLQKAFNPPPKPTKTPSNPSLKAPKVPKNTQNA